MTKIVDTNEIVADIGQAVTKALKEHGIEPTSVKVRVDPEEIRVLVDLKDPEE